MLWTLPVEIKYYFIVPIYAFVMAAARRYWLMANGLVLILTIYPSITIARGNHEPLLPFLATFICGSACGVLWVHLSQLVEKRPPGKITQLGFQCISYFLAMMIASNIHHEIIWTVVGKDPFQTRSITPYTNTFVGLLIVNELLFPTELTKLMEWNVFQFLGKACFPVYLLHESILELIKPYPGYTAFFLLIVGITAIGKAGLMIEKQINDVCLILCKAVESKSKYDAVIDDAVKSPNRISKSVAYVVGKRFVGIGKGLQDQMTEVA
jgi:peptidoglycan/LPS O-acetylase OafA/YrhL